jgi:hypothetical protein
MEGTNGTNLKQVAPILFFKQVYENRGVYILCPDWWLERPRSIYTPCGLVAWEAAEYVYSARAGGLRGRGVYILHADWWLERLRSIYTPPGLVA